LEVKSAFAAFAVAARAAVVVDAKCGVEEKSSPEAVKAAAAEAEALLAVVEELAVLDWGSRRMLPDPRLQQQAEVVMAGIDLAGLARDTPAQMFAAEAVVIATLGAAGTSY
jgi:hypothetical protein